MGCDIHLWVEVKREGEWRPLDGDAFYNGRNYRLFTLLAGVRNYGPHSGIKPVSEPRGLPKDATAEARRECDEWGAGAHSPSWVTLLELEAVDWAVPVQMDVVLSADDYAGWLEKDKVGSPPGWCSWASGPHVTEAEMQRLIRSGELPKGKWLHCEAAWEMPLSEAVGDEFMTALPKLRALGPPEDVRLVFWFDN